MSVTREEAAHILEYSRIVSENFTQEAVTATYVMALAALRGPTREQVEKMRGRFFQAGIDDVAQDTWRCSRCLVQEFGNIQGINFCPACGAPMTDKAVDMVMERLEALYGQENT